MKKCKCYKKFYYHPMLSYSPMCSQLKPVGLFKDSQQFLKKHNI